MDIQLKTGCFEDAALVRRVLPGSAERERIRIHAGIEKLDRERAVGDLDLCHGAPSILKNGTGSEDPAPAKKVSG